MLDGPQNDVVHGQGFSLNQKVMFARNQGEKTITLYLEDAERELEGRRQQDLLVAKLMDHVPESVLKQIGHEVFQDETAMEHI